MQQDSLQALSKVTSSTAEPIVATSLNWLVAFVQAYVWQEPKAIGFMLIAYHVALGAELWLHYKAGQLSWRLTGRKLLATHGNSLGAIILLYIATGSAKYNSWFFYLPQLVFAVLLSALIILIVKQFSKIGIISPLVAQLIESKISMKLNENNPESPAEPVEPGLVEPEKEITE
jgi:peptidoglycan/LPS O-acetylase OafA/YrhL